MLGLVLRRVLWMIPTLLAVSVISFAIIELPPGDYVTAQVAMLKETGEEVNQEKIAALRRRYNLDMNPVERYFRWLGGMLRGDLGRSMEWDRPVTEIIGERILLTTAISILTLLLTWGLAVPIGIYSAVRKYSVGDYAFTFLGFIGLATPPFLLALIFMYLSYSLFGVSAGGLFSVEYEGAPWSMAKLADLLAHIWIPVVIIGMAGTAGLIRIMRGNLLDELGKQYVTTARAKGVHPVTLLLKYPVRVALNPLVSTLGWLLPAIISGATITSLVLGLPTTGPVLLRALRNQDMYLAGSIVMLLSTLTIIGTLISDLLLLWLDPRVRYESRAR
jgi:peptide/nickel transport system permease protein